MPRIIPYDLTFQGGIHVGQSGVNLEESGATIHSDTLFAALVDAFRRSGGNMKSFIDHFFQPDGNLPSPPPFMITSAFPFAGRVRFFPLPVDRSWLFTSQTMEKHRKELKKIQFFSEGLLREALKGQTMEEWLFSLDGNLQGKGVALQGGALWMKQDEVKKLPYNMRKPPEKSQALRYFRLWKNEPVPRVTVDRITSSSTIYYAGKVNFLKDCGLWFGVNWNSEEDVIKNAFETSLRILENDGLGGERSSGYGGFRAKADREMLELSDPEEGGLAYLLGRYHPRRDELPDAIVKGQASYQLAAVGGWARSLDGADQRRKRVVLVSEGSLINFPGSPAGDVVDVVPTYQNSSGDLPHPVLRYGLALTCAWNKGAEI